MSSDGLFSDSQLRPLDEVRMKIDQSIAIVVEPAQILKSRNFSFEIKSEEI